MILSIISIVFAVVAIGYSAHCAIVFQKFNDGIKDWASELDDSMVAAINMAARNILRDLDSKISKISEISDDEGLNSNSNDYEEN